MTLLIHDFRLLPKSKPVALFLLLLVICLVTRSFAQEKTYTATGKVLDAVSRKGVKAKIFYKSLPTGSLTGRFNDSTFTFSIFGTAKYQITAEAEGYITATAIVDPKLVNQENKVVRDLLMTRKGETIVLEHLIFEQGKAVINPASYPGLDELTALMKDNEKLEIQLEGHTDNQGNPQANLKLSQERVDNVKKYITSRGVAKDRIKTKAFGGTKPIVQGNSNDARARNRRVEMRILKD